MTQWFVVFHSILCFVKRETHQLQNFCFGRAGAKADVSLMDVTGYGARPKTAERSRRQVGLVKFLRPNNFGLSCRWKRAKVKMKTIVTCGVLYGGLVPVVPSIHGFKRFWEAHFFLEHGKHMSSVTFWFLRMGSGILPSVSSAFFLGGTALKRPWLVNSSDAFNVAPFQGNCWKSPGLGSNKKILSTLQYGSRRFFF